DALDVPRRMRVRQGSDSSAGIWFRQQSSTTDNAFVGMQDSSHIGLYGSAGAGWGLLMDTTNGKVNTNSLQATSVQTTRLDAGYAEIASSPGYLAEQVAGHLKIAGHPGYMALSVEGPVTMKTHQGTAYTPLTVEQTKPGGYVALRVSGGPVIVNRYEGLDYSIWAAQTIYSNQGLVSRDHIVTVDHPLDPVNRNLSHSAVQAPDRTTLYDGTVVTDDQGEATVQLPDYVEAFNCNFRYQLTPVADCPVLAMVVREIDENSFVVRTDRPRTKVCWQVSGTRCDEWASRNSLEAVSDKLEEERKVGELIRYTDEPRSAASPPRRIGR
ncbi:hypothetical protein ABT040_29880, partial [Streptomyces sp. NPDC002688]|uniref:hypothetical protein n=1 Tax=Streptomyces sp. NPDC002688 TaxID=3154423 RepID=UPI00332B17F8